jgi:hypothetical protein
MRLPAEVVDAELSKSNGHTGDRDRRAATSIPASAWPTGRGISHGDTVGAGVLRSEAIETRIGAEARSRSPVSPLRIRCSNRRDRRGARRHGHAQATADHYRTALRKCNGRRDHEQRDAKDYLLHRSASFS